MTRSKSIQVLLFITGLTGVVIGGSILFAPTPFYAAYGIILSGDSNLLNEIRPQGGFLLASGILILMGLRYKHLLFPSLMTSTALYLSYAASRGLSLLLDGRPSSPLITVLIVELLFGLASLYALVQHRDQHISQTA